LSMDGWFAGGAFVLACAAAILAIKTARWKSPPPAAASGYTLPPPPARSAVTLGGQASWIPPAPDALVFFTLSGCEYCERLLTHVATTGVDRPYVVIQQGTDSELRAQGERLRLPLDRLIADPEGALLDAYGIERVPHALRLEAGQIVRSISVDELTKFDHGLLL
jgi:hypothetical protein